MERFLPWQKFGVDTTASKTACEVLDKSGLNWDVETRPVFWEGKDTSVNPIPSKMAVVREDDQSFISEIDFRDNVINNKDAFGFVDSLIDHYGATIEKAGYDDCRKSSYMICKLDPSNVLGDKVDNYLVIANNFNGTKTPLQISYEPLRCVCSNQLDTLYRSKSTLKFHVAPSEDMYKTMVENIFRVKSDSMNALEAEANKLASLTYSKENFYKLVDNLYPTDEDLYLTNQKRSSNEYMKTNLLSAYNQEDLNNFRETVWGAMNAIVDFIGHTQSYRDKNNNKEMDYFKSLEIMKNSTQFILYLKSLILKNSFKKTII